MGRGTSDLIFKDNEVMLRAGKIKSINVKPPLRFPEINKNRGFLQLSYFNLNKIDFIQCFIREKKYLLINILSPSKTI